MEFNVDDARRARGLPTLGAAAGAGSGGWIQRKSKSDAGAGSGSGSSSRPAATAAEGDDDDRYSSQFFPPNQEARPGYGERKAGAGAGPAPTPAAAVGAGPVPAAAAVVDDIEDFDDDEEAVVDSSFSQVFPPNQEAQSGYGSAKKKQLPAVFDFD
jgi:hypothetical protein